MQVPTGMDLLNTLSYAYPDVQYTLVGIEFDPHESLDGTAAGLSWPNDIETPRPTAAVLAQKWSELQAMQAADQSVNNRDWASFREELWQMDDGQVMAIAKGTKHANDWSLWLSLLNSPPKDVVVLLNTLLDVRRGLKVDLTAQQCDLITQAAAKCGIPLVIPTAIPAN